MATFTNIAKNSTTWTNIAKNSTAWTNIAKSVLASLWSASVYPWQEALPWQYPAGGTLTTWTNIAKN